VTLFGLVTEGGHGRGGAMWHILLLRRPRQADGAANLLACLKDDCPTPRNSVAGIRSTF
jgi:hypothetical protein